MNRGYSKFLTITLIIIITAVIGLLGYLGFDYYSRLRTNNDAAEAVDSFIGEASVEKPTTTPVTPSNSSTENNITTNSIATDSNTEEQSSNNTKTRTYKGFNMIGTIEIPKTGAKYPILDKVTKKSLETSVAVIWPEKAELNKPGNVVIVGHNYRNGVFFSNNKKLSKGDKIYITDLNGNKVTYEIYKIFQTSDSDTEFYNRDTDGKREITLSTCTDDSSARLIIQAK